MKRITLFALFSVLLNFVSCTDGIEMMPGAMIGQELTFEATFGDEPSTKTVVQSDGKSIWWSAHEAINIFYGDSESSKFTSTNDEPVAKAKFKGSIEGFTGETESGEPTSFWAIYPYDEANTCDGTAITATLPGFQTGKAETFSDKQWMTMAKNYGLSLSFYAVGAGFRFSVTKEGVTSVIFKGNNNEVLAGKAKIGMDANNRPVVQEHLTGVKEVILSAPDGESFEVGKLYYLAFYPTNFTKGFTVTFNTATETGTRVYDNAIDFKRTDVHRGKNFDSGIEYHSIQAKNQILYTSTTGQIVTPHSTAFAATIASNEYDNGQGIMTFAADLTEIPKYAFYECTDLLSVSLHNSITSIGESAFQDCTSLQEINIPTGVTTMDYYVFSGCKRLEMTIPDHIKTIKDRAFRGCIMPNVVIPAGLTEITVSLWSPFDGVAINTISVESGNTKYDSRDNCNAIIETASNTLLVASNHTVIPPSVKTIGVNSFGSVSNMRELDIPFGVETIKSKAISGRSSLLMVSLPASMQTIEANSFSGCSKLSTVICEAVDVPYLGPGVFSSTPAGMKIFVPDFCKSSYLSDVSWRSFSINDLSVINNGDYLAIGKVSGKLTTRRLRTYENLSISDVRDLEAIAGADYNGNATSGRLRYLDMRASSLVGSEYDENDSYSSYSEWEAPLANWFSSGIFWKCNSLNIILLPDGITNISKAMPSCQNLLAVWMGNNVSSITDSFRNCDKLKHIYCSRTTPPSMDTKTKNNLPSTCVIHVPSEAVSSYRSAANWKDFSIVEL